MISSRYGDTLKIFYKVRKLQHGPPATHARALDGAVSFPFVRSFLSKYAKEQAALYAIITYTVW